MYKCQIVSGQTRNKVDYIEDILEITNHVRDLRDDEPGLRSNPRLALLLKLGRILKSLDKLKETSFSLHDHFYSLPSIALTSINNHVHSSGSPDSVFSLWTASAKCVPMCEFCR